MNTQPPIIDAPEAPDEAKRLAAIFDEMEIKQLEFLDQAAKSLIERTAALLAVLFAVTAFGDTFPPPYLRDNLPAKFLAMVALAFYIFAMMAGMLALHPRFYPRHRYNLTMMRLEFEKLIDGKMRPLQFAGLLFWLGSVTLSVLIGTIFWSA